MSEPRASHPYLPVARRARIKAGTATSYNATNNPGLQSASYYRLAKSGDDLFIATGLGVSRINEASGQVTVANASTTGNLNYIANDIVVDGPVAFTADNNYSSTILYRGSNPDAPNQLRRGTCDTRPLISNDVSACNGNASYSDTDLALLGKGMPLLFARSYNAQDSRAGPFGPGWTHSFDMALTFNPFATVVMVRQGDGRRDKYQKNADGTYTGQAGVYDTLVKNGDGTYSLTQKDQTKFNFNASGRLTNIVDRNGNASTPAYDADGKITTITDTAGRVITLAYDASAKVSSLTDNISRVWTYAYNADGRLSSVTNPLAGVTTYTYNAAGQLLTVADPRGNAQLNNVFVGGMLTQQKDAPNNAISFSFATSPPSLVVTDRRGKTTTTFLDDLGRAKRAIGA